QQGFARREDLFSKSKFGADEISQALINLEQTGEIILRQHIAADSEFWRKVREQAIRLIDAMHKETPERTGVDLNELRSALRIQKAEVFESLLADLCERGFVRKGSIVASASHRPKLPGQVQPVEKRIREALSKQPFDPPSRKAIESDPQARLVVRFLI